VGGGCTRETWTSSPAACSVTMRHCLLGGAGARRAYIRCRAMRSFCKVEHPLLALAFPTARLLNTLSVRHLKRPSLPRTGLFGKLERLNSACSSAKRADAVRISHTLHTHHPSLDLAYLPILVFNKACIPPCCPLHHLHAHSLSFSSVPIVAIRHNCHSLLACSRAVTPSTSCFDTSPPSPQQTCLSSSLHLSPNQTTHFHLATPTLSFTKKKLTFISAGR
jgi:hypothetical protein